MNKKLIYVVIGVLVLMIISNIILISMIIDYKNTIPIQIDNSVKSTVNQLKVYDKIDNLIELKVSSIKLVDGKDGVSIKVEKGDSIKGDKGDSIKGDTGLSAYDIAVKNGFEGTQEEWLQSLKGVSGNDGGTAIPRCNVSRNQWEQRFNKYSAWGAILDENNNPVPCTIKE